MPVPFAIAENGARGAVIFAANSAARRAGVQPGLTVSDAKAICPKLVTTPSQRDEDSRALLGLARWLGRYGPNRNVDGTDGLWVEITGVAHLFGDERKLAENLTTRLSRAGFSARVGIAETYAAAYGLARYGCARGERVVVAESGSSRATLASLPVDALRLSDDSLLLLKRLGLRRVGQLQSIPRAALARRFRDEIKSSHQHGRKNLDCLVRAVVWRLDQMFGETDEPKRPLEPPPIRLKQQNFPEPLISNDGVVAAVRNLSRRLSADLVATGVGSLELRLSVYRSDGTVGALSLALARPSGDPDHIFKLFEMRLSEIDVGLGADAIALEALRVAPLKSVQNRFDETLRTSNRSQAFNDLVDRLITRLGADRVLSAEACDSHIPERACRFRPVVASAVSSRRSQAPPDAPAKECEALAFEDPRPQLMLERPEPIDVLAELPEGPPAHFRWRRRRCRIRRASGPERIAPEWWRVLNRPQIKDHETEADGDDVNQPDGALVGRPEPRPRDYFVLEDEMGGRYWVFRDGLYQRSATDGPPNWYLHGLFT